jgi:PsbP
LIFNVSTFVISVSLSISIFIIFTFVLSSTNIDSNIWNVFASTETSKTTVNTSTNTSSSNITKENNLSLSSPMLSYTNSTYGIKIQYPSNWNILKGPATIYHNQSKNLNVVAEILAPIQSSYYNPKIGASHNSIRLVVEDYNTFGDYINTNIDKYIGKNNNNSSIDIKNKLLNVANKRIGAIGTYCLDFDLKSWNQSSTLSESPAHQIFLDYSYANYSKDATEIWTIKNNKIFLIEFVAQDKIFSLYTPIVKKMIESFQIINPS